MIIPVRCFSCGKVSDIRANSRFARETDNYVRQVVGDLWTKYVKLIDPENGEGLTEGYVRNTNGREWHGDMR
jgi:DNA-directed RNA polymerase subunit N (RpoN/RPB10)